MGEAKRRGPFELRKAIAKNQNVLINMQSMFGKEHGSKAWLQINHCAIRAREFYYCDWYKLSRIDRQRLVAISALAEGRLMR